MNSAFRIFGDLLAGGGYIITLPLLAVCAAMWILILERARAMGEAPWEALLPPGRRKKATARAHFSQAFRAYLSAPDESTREALLSRSLALGTPIGLFVRRVFAGAASAASPPRPTMIEAAVYLGEREAFFGLGVVRTLTCVALLLGVLGALGGLHATFDALNGLGAHAEAGWTAGVERALGGSKVAAAVALPGMAAGAWLSHRAACLAREIRARGTQLHRAAHAALEAAP